MLSPMDPDRPPPFYEKFTPPSLEDLHGRTISYLRISVTDRCNFRCTYCMPAEGVDPVARAELLSFEEYERIARVFAAIGVRTVRITGGEPTVRRGIVELVERIARIPGITDVAMTTNGMVLEALAGPLRAAGLTRLNVSVDSVRPEAFAELTRGEDVARVIAGIDAARAAGFADVKTNAVIVRGVNDADAPALVAWAWERGLVPRFIELMPMGEGERLVAEGKSVPNAEVRARLGNMIEDAPRGKTSGQGPAVYWLARGRPERKVGFIGAMTENFCAGCNRVRLTSTGELRPCLASLRGVSLRDQLRAGASDEALLALVAETLYGKKAGHEFVEGTGTNRLIGMSTIGG